MKNGIYKDLSIDDYHDNKTHFSASSLKYAKKSLKHFKWYREGLFETGVKTHFEFGNAFETVLCEGHEGLMNHVALYDPEERPEQEKGITSKKNQEWKKEIWGGLKYVINKDGKESLHDLLEMVDSCTADPTIEMLLQKRDYQTSIFWTDKTTGLNLKTRPDMLNSEKNIMVEIKTTLDGSPSKFARDAANYDYFFQAIMQMDGVLSSGLMAKIDNYFYLVVEKVPPYNATIYELDIKDIEFLRTQYDYVLNMVAQAIKADKFPGYNQRADNKFGILTLDIPLFYQNSF